MKNPKKAVLNAAKARKKKAAKKARKGLPLPSSNRFYIPVLRTLQDMGGNAQVRDVVSRIVGQGKHTEAQLNIVDNLGRSVLTKRIEWARAVLVGVDYIVASRYGKWGWWKLTSKGRMVNLANIDEEQFIQETDQAWREKYQPAPPSQKRKGHPSKSVGDSGVSPAEESEFGDDLLRRLHRLTPTAFEHFCKRLLSEVGFIKVEVTQKAHDGGIDGTGILEVNPFITTSFVFQCKRYKETPVGPDKVNQLRGVIAGGAAQKGAIITTSRFTKKAREAAEGHSPIELIDGDRLVELMVKYRVGVKESVEVDKEFFKEFEQDNTRQRK